jgi:hypothetical protein
VTKFSTRQAAISGAERVKKHRERQVKQDYYETHYEGSNEDVTMRYTDIDIETDIDIDKNREEEEYTPTPLTKLSTAFCNATQIPEMTGGAPKWNGALTDMVKVGIEPEDIAEAVAILDEKNYTIVGPWSVRNTALDCMRKRKGKRTKEKAGADYVGGKYAEFIEH